MEKILRNVQILLAKLNEYESHCLLIEGLFRVIRGVEINKLYTCPGMVSQFCAL